MTTLTLSRVWLNLASDPSQSVTFQSANRSDDRSLAGEVRRYANGRLRAVSRPGSAQTLQVTARNLTPTQVALLESWRGVTLLFRDVWGRRLFGTYFALTISDYPDRSGQDATFTFSQLTYSEAV